MEKLTKALMTDETGQAIVDKLNALSGQMHELAMATRGSAILFESASDISVLGDGGYLAVYVGSTNPLVISGWTGDNSLVTGNLYYLIKSGTAVASSDLGEYGGAAADAKAVEDALAKKADADDVGDLSQLTTTAKDNLVSAINEANEAVTGINERLDENVSDLKSALEYDVSHLADEEYVEIMPVPESGYMKITGEIDTGYYYTAPISVVKGDTYKIKCQTGSAIRAYVLINEGGDVVDYYDTQDAWGTNHDYDVTVTAKADGTLYINSILSGYLGAKKLTYVLANQDQVDAAFTSAEAVDAVTQYVESYNLFTGAYYDGYRTGSTPNTSRPGKYAYSQPILLQPGNYLFAAVTGVIGSDAKRVIRLNNALSYRDYITATELNDLGGSPARKLCTFALSEPTYIELNLGYQSTAYAPADMSSFMLTVGSTSDEYPPFQKYFSPYYAIKNGVGLSEEMKDEVNGLSGLIGKSAIFDGDSICNGTSVGASDSSYGLGYAGRIGNANQMTWKNYGINGGVISSASTPGMSGKHSVLDNVDTLHTDYPDADYVIFEGGTNDADTIGDAISDPDIMGTLNPTDYSGSYDTTTFTGALETIFYKATGYWKGKKIGYIVAHKMGYGYVDFDKEHANRRAFFERAMQVCKKWGIPYLNLWDDCYLNPRNANLYDNSKTANQNIAAGNLYTDGQHLTAVGYDYISPIIEDWMKSL